MITESPVFMDFPINLFIAVDILKCHLSGFSELLLYQSMGFLAVFFQLRSPLASGLSYRV